MEKAKKLALLVGGNYPKTHYELHGCHNDVLAMHESLITRFGFHPNHIELLLDKPGSHIMPTGANIKKALNHMVDRAEAGDVLFFVFSGHGTSIQHHNSHKKEEAIIPCDFNLMLLDPQYKEKEQIMPSTSPVKGTVNATASHKAKQIPFESILQYFTTLTGQNTTDIGTHLLQVFGPDASLMFHHGVEPTSKPLKLDEGILLSGNKEIVILARKILAQQHFKHQHPCLYLISSFLLFFLVHKFLGPVWTYWQAVQAITKSCGTVCAQHKFGINGDKTSIMDI